MSNSEDIACRQLPRHGWISFAQGLSVLRKETLGDLSYYGDEEHLEFLEAKGLRSARTLLECSEGLLVNRSSVKSVIHLDGPAFGIRLKCFYEPRPTHIFKRVFGQGLHCLGRLEVENILWLRSRSFATADLLFWGHTTWMGLDGAFSFVGLRELTGYHELRDDFRPEALAASCELLVKLVREGFYWPDAKADHFLIGPEHNEATVVDLHRGRRRKSLGDRDLRKMVRTFLESLSNGSSRDCWAVHCQLEDLALREISERPLRSRFYKVLQQV
jgi:hypothetical protein